MGVMAAIPFLPSHAKLVYCGSNSVRWVPSLSSIRLGYLKARYSSLKNEDIFLARPDIFYPIKRSHS